MKEQKIGGKEKYDYNETRKGKNDGEKDMLKKKKKKEKVKEEQQKE